jgi:hypothetical protein
LTSPGSPATGQKYGNAVDLSFDGGVLAIGEPIGTTSTSGRTLLYNRTGPTNWTFSTELNPFDSPPADNFFGWIVKMTPDTRYVAVGGPGDVTGSSIAGRSYIYERVDPTNLTYNEVLAITPSSSANGDLFGASLGISNLLGSAVIGSNRRVSPSPVDGSAFYYEGTTPISLTVLQN